MNDVQPDPELILEDDRSFREGLWRMARCAQDAAELIDAKGTHGRTPAEPTRPEDQLPRLGP